MHARVAEDVPQPLETTAKCDGCSKQIDLLKNHLIVTEKVQKLAWVAPQATGPSEAVDVEEEDEAQPFLGSRSGVGVQLVFHDNECRALHAEKVKGKSLKLKLNTDDSDPYNSEE
jgi:hypothetical protein